MRFLTRLFHPKGFSVSLEKGGSTFVYRERGRRIQVSGEAMADGYAVYASSIRHWDNGRENGEDSAPSELIDENERQRIATNIRNHLVDRGKNVYLS